MCCTYVYAGVCVGGGGGSELHLSLSLWALTGTFRMSSRMRSDHGTENSTIATCQMAFSHLVITMLGLIVVSSEAQSEIV